MGYSNSAGCLCLLVGLLYVVISLIDLVYLVHMHIFVSRANPPNTPASYNRPRTQVSDSRMDFNNMQ